MKDFTKKEKMGDSVIDNNFVMLAFHGGCDGCTQQMINAVEFCMSCQYFDGDWDLPNLSNKPPTPAELKRAELKEKVRKSK